MPTIPERADEIIASDGRTVQEWLDDLAASSPDSWVVASSGDGFVFASDGSGPVTSTSEPE